VPDRPSSGAMLLLFAPWSVEFADTTGWKKRNKKAYKICIL